MPDPLGSYTYQHPELDSPWAAQAANDDEARLRFEDCWALRVQAGLLEAVDGNFFDGTITLAAMPLEENLCPNDLSGHFWSDDDRPIRVEVPSTQTKAKTHRPVACILCEATSWKRRPEEQPPRAA